MAELKILTEADFKDGIASGLIVVDMYADWCGPCKQMAPIFARVADDYEGKVTFAKINIDQAQSIAREYGVMSIPTLIFFKDGEVFKKAIGLQDENLIKANAEALLSA